MHYVSIEIDPEDILDKLDNEDIIRHIGLQNALDEIFLLKDIEFIVEYFGIPSILRSIDKDSIKEWLNEN